MAQVFSDGSYLPVSRTGDLWILGNHRVLCGDATQIEAVERLMQDEKADCVFTDPPYNLDYQGRTKDQLTLANDNLCARAFLKFLMAVFASYRMAAKRQASLYVCHSYRTQRECQNALEANGFVVRNQLVWAKQHFSSPFGRYKSQHELIFYCHRRSKSDGWYGDTRQSTVWAMAKPAANRLHPTMKPLAVIERALINSSQIGDCVLDLLAGSGSTLIAAEHLKRRAYLMEIEPHYVDVIVQRWQTLTGKNAILQSTGQSFTVTAQQRQNPVSSVHGSYVVNAECVI